MPWSTSKRKSGPAKGVKPAPKPKVAYGPHDLAVYGDPAKDRGSLYADHWSTSSGWDRSGYAFGHYASLNSPAAAAFVKRATAWADREETGAEPVPLRFAAYRYSHGFGTRDPLFGFDELSEAQLAWYFTWRAAVRRGESPPVGDAYVVLLATEVVNGVGVLDAAQGFRALAALDAAYGQSYGLRTQLGDLLEDYALVHGLDEDLDAAMRERGWREQGPYFTNRAIQARVQGDLSAVPYGMVAELSGIDLDVASDFLLDNDLAMAHFVPRALAAVDELVRREGKGGVVERLAPKVPTPVERVAFLKVNYVGKRETVLVPRPPFYTSGDRIQALMKGVMRHTENRLRAATKAKGRTSGYVLAEAHKAAVDEAIQAGLPAFVAEHGGSVGAAGFPAPVRVSVDPATVGRLQVESDAVRGMLIEAMGSEAPGGAPAPVPPSPASTPVREAVPLGPDDGDRLPLTGSQRAALTAMLGGGDVGGELRRLAGAMGLMPDVLVDGINEVAVDWYGEAVVDTSGPTPRVHEEYRDELAAMVGR